MVHYLIICRSLTYAQRTASLLERAGISAYIMRSPRIADAEGCSHAVRVRDKNITAALRILAREEMNPKRVFVLSEDGGYQEVFL